jgi:hypothetical protein
LEKISIRFDGKIATTGKLHFYEYGRYQYATARFISTIEHFRRTGIVAKKISGKAKIEIYVSPAQQGSFVEDILVPAIKQGSAAAVSTSLTTLISYIWHLLVPISSETESDIIKIAQIRAQEEGERTKQFEAMQRIVEVGAATNSQALELVHWAQRSGNTRLGGEGLLSGRLGEMEQELLDHETRENIFNEDAEILNSIDSEDIQKLLSRTASIVPDMALPMRRSADTAVFSSTRSKLPVLRLDQKTAQMISTKRLDPEVFQYSGRIRAYDVDIGVGKFVSDEFDRPINFSVPPLLRERWKELILEAMKEPQIKLFAQRYLDRANLPTSLLFNSI